MSKKYKRKYEDGYQWMSGRLVKNNDPGKEEVFLDDMCGDSNHPFDKGARDALYDFCNHIVKDK